MKCDSEDCCADVDSIINGDKLSDLEINFAQKLLKQQFPALNGLQCTLFQSKPQICKPLQLQVIHCRTRDHWIVASNRMCKDGELNVYDSVYFSLDEETSEVTARLFHGDVAKVVEMQKQDGGKDCGLFAIAISTAIAYGVDPISLHFNQAAMRNHLVHCFKDQVMTLFPVS